jgi:hypothetical protein
VRLTVSVGMIILYIYIYINICAEKIFTDQSFSMPLFVLKYETSHI